MHLLVHATARLHTRQVGTGDGTGAHIAHITPGSDRWSAKLVWNTYRPCGEEQNTQRAALPFLDPLRHVEYVTKCDTFL